MTVRLHTTSLHDRRRTSGALWMSFAGWEMPVECAVVRAEPCAGGKDA